MSISYKPMITIGDRLRKDVDPNSTKSLQHIIANLDKSLESKFSLIIIDYAFQSFKSNDCKPILVNPHVVNRASLVSKVKISTDIELMTSPMVVMMPERTSLSSFMLYVGKFKDIIPQHEDGKLSQLLDTVVDVDEPMVVTYYGDTTILMGRLVDMVNSINSGKIKNADPEDKCGLEMLTIALNIRNGLESGNLVLDSDIPKGFTYRFANTLTGLPSVNCVMLKDPSMEEPHDDKVELTLKDEILSIRKTLGISDTKVPVSKVKQKKLYKQLQIELEEKEKREYIQRLKLSNAGKSDQPKPKVVKAVEKEPKQLKAHIHPKEYAQFVDLVTEFKNEVHDTREAIRMACEDMNRTIVEPVAYYKWKELVEKERAKGSELIQGDVAEAIKQKLEKETMKTSNEIRRLQASLGMKCYIPKSEGEQSAYLEMLKQLDDTIPELKYLRKGINKNCNRLGLIVDETRLTGRKEAYDYLSTLKQKATGEVTSGSKLSIQIEEVKSEDKTPSTESKIYCVNKECSNLVDKVNTLCVTCHVNSGNIELFEDRTCIVEGCNTLFANRIGDDRQYCSEHLVGRSKTIGGEVVVSEDARRDFVEFLQIYILDGKPIVESLMLAARSANIHEVGDLELVGKWCRKYGASFEREHVTDSGRTYRSIALKSAFVKCYNELRKHTKYKKGELCEIVSNILGTPIVSSTLLGTWVNGKVDEASISFRVKLDDDEVTSTVVEETTQPKTIKFVADLNSVNSFIKTADKDILFELETMIASRKSTLLSALRKKHEEMMGEMRRKQEEFQREIERLEGSA